MAILATNKSSYLYSDQITASSLTSTFIGEHAVSTVISQVSKLSQSRGTSSALFEQEAVSGDIEILRNQGELEKVQSPLIPRQKNSTIEQDAVVLQIWEGRVLTVNRNAEVMQVILSAKMGNIPEHTGEIELQWVAEQDIDLVRPGAVFYLTLYKQTKRGSIQNAQELRFRRRPDWTKRQIDQITLDAERLRSKMKARPIAE
jgi:hypothetical protein